MALLIRSILLGLLTTLALAWLLAAFVPIPMYPPGFLTRAWLDSEARAYTGFEVRLPGVIDLWWNEFGGEPGDSEVDALQGARDYLITFCSELRSTEQAPRFRDGPPALGTFCGRVPVDLPEAGSETAFGLPFPCLWYSVRSDVQGTKVVSQKLVGGVMIQGTPSSRLRDFHALPLRPAWARLLANTACWSIAWWLSAACIAGWRKRRRRRRGLCPSCGYSLAGLVPSTPTLLACPECGAPQPNPPV